MLFQICFNFGSKKKNLENWLIFDEAKTYKNGAIFLAYLAHAVLTDVGGFNVVAAFDGAESGRTGTVQEAVHLSHIHRPNAFLRRISVSRIYTLVLL